MKVLTIKRVCMTEYATLGVMIEELNPRIPFCLTLELPWKSNQKGISCIPKGEYRLTRIRRPNGQITFEIMNVPNRTAILIHKGNWTTDTEGCVILGEQFEQVLNPKADKVVTAVLSSGHAFNEFMKIMHGQETGTLVIEEA